MPTPDRTSLAEIVAAARTLLDEGGPGALTMQAVATRVGVKAPSLYKRVRDRDALLALVLEAAADDLMTQLMQTGGGLDDIAREYRRFAHTQPESFRLMFSATADSAMLDRLSQPVLAAARATVGDRDHLEAARLVTAWATGFVTMELAGAFRLGGDVGAAFDYGLDRIMAGLAVTPAPAES